MARVLIVDDEPHMRWVLTEALTKAGHTPQGAESGPEALALLAHTPVELVLLDLKLKGMDGLAALRAIHERWPDIVVIMLTAYGTLATAVEALQSGAADYLRKPFDVEELTFKLARALERQQLRRTVAQYRDQRSPMPTGTHPVWRRAVEAAIQGLDVQLVGEPGSGRATIARYAHAAGSRREAPLVERDLATLPPERQGELLKGVGRQEGFWAQGGGGVVLLRHTEALSAEGAAALQRLRAHRAQTGVGPLLITTALPDAAHDQQSAIVHVPPLRDHRADIPLLVGQWLSDQPITAGALAVLEQHDWPGNIAELRGVVERAKWFARDGSITEQHLPVELRSTGPADALVRLPPDGINLEEVEVSLIRQALALAGGNKSRAAELLGLTRHTLLYRLEKYGISEP
jgi:DNA-binding NtrC family response regulator